MNNIKITFFILLVTLLTACGNNTKMPIQTDVAAISINQRTPFIYSTDLKTVLTATVMFDDNTTADATYEVNWYNSDYNVSSMKNGEVWGGIANGGDTNITISYGNFSDYVTLHVIQLTDFNISIQDNDVNTTGTYNLVLTGTFEDNTTRTIYNNVTYSVTNGALITTDDNNVTTVQITATGETNVTAKLFYDNNLTKTLTYTAN